MINIVKFIICIYMLIGLCACESTNTDNNTNNDSLTTENITMNIQPLGGQDILSMSNYMNEQDTVSNGAWIYGVSFNEDGHGVLSKIKDDGTELTQLSDNGSSYINVIGGWIYYVAYDYSRESISINKIRISGEDEKIIVKDDNSDYEIQAMFIYNDKIYFTKNHEPSNGKISGKLYRTDLDGANIEVVLDKAVYYPYIINDKIIYQDDADDFKIHICNLDGSNDNVLIDKGVFQYFVNGEYIYYQTTDKPLRFDENHNIDLDDFNRIIERCNLDGSNQEEIVTSADVNAMTMNETTIYYVDSDDEYRLYSYDIASGSVDLISQDTYINRIALFPNKIFYYDYTEKFEYIENLYLSELDGTYKDTLFTDW